VFTCSIRTLVQTLRMRNVCVVRKDLAKLRHFTIVGPCCVGFPVVLNSPSNLMEVIREALPRLVVLKNLHKGSLRGSVSLTSCSPLAQCSSV
jgi:hypothetical protein